MLEAACFAATGVTAYRHPHTYFFALVKNEFYRLEIFYIFYRYPITLLVPKRLRYLFVQGGRVSPVFATEPQAQRCRADSASIGDPNRVIQSCACFINPFLFMMYRLKFV